MPTRGLFLSAGRVYLTLVTGLHFQYVETRFLKLRDRKANRDAERLVVTSPPASAL
jgi:hypothetical protein